MDSCYDLKSGRWHRVFISPGMFSSAVPMVTQLPAMKGDNTMAAPILLTDATFKVEVVDSSTPVLVDFWAAWCGPCRMVSPIVDQVADEYEGRLKVGKVDVHVERQVATDYGICSIPALLIFEDGAVADQFVGALPKEQLTEKIDAVL